MFLFLMWLSTHIVYAGKDTTVFVMKKNCVYAELGGRALLWSINYEHIFRQKTHFAFGWQAGLSYSELGVPSTYLPMPVSLFCIRRFAVSSWFFESSIGITALPNFRPTSKADRDEYKNHPRDYGRAITYPFDLWGSGSIGIRYQRKWLFGVSFVPLYGRSTTDLKYYYKSRVGIQIGKAF